MIYNIKVKHINNKMSMPIQNNVKTFQASKILTVQTSKSQ